MNANLSTVLLLGLVTCAMSSSVIAQNTAGTPVNTPVQLPVVSFFNVRTVVSVPDGGVMNLGGVSRHASSQSWRGIPGLGRAFSNRSGGYATTASKASVRVQIISNSEMSDDVLLAANRRSTLYESRDPNGSKSVQAKADFISRNVGGSRR